MAPGASDPERLPEIWGDAERRAWEEIAERLRHRYAKLKHKLHYDADGRRCVYHLTTRPIGKRRDLS